MVFQYLYIKQKNMIQVSTQFYITRIKYLFQMLTQQRNYNPKFNSNQGLMKKQSISKATKAISRNFENGRDSNTYSYKQLPETRDISQISNLEKRLNEQINAREQGYNELFQMIKHLDETKKSKLPVNYYKICSKKAISSPHKCQTATSIQLEQIAHFKEQIANLTSKQQLEQSNYRIQLNQIQRQIKGIKNQIQQNKKFKQNQTQQIQQLKIRLKQCVSQLKSQLPQVHSAIKRQSQQKVKLQTIITKLESQQNGVRSQIKMLEQYRITLANLSQQFKIFKSDVLDNQNYLNEKLEQQRNGNSQNKKLFRKFYESLQNTNGMVNGYGIEISNFQLQLRTVQDNLHKMDWILKGIQQKLSNQFNLIGQQVQKCNQSIGETKCNIQQILYGQSITKLKSNNKTVSQMATNNLRLTRGQTELAEKIKSNQLRMESVQRRLDFLYDHYLSKPITISNEKF